MKVTYLLALSAICGTCAFAQDAPQPSAAGGQRPGGGQRQMPPELIKQFDKDGDGKLSDDERTAMMTEMKAKREAQMKADLEKYDTSKDGKLDEAETKAMREAKQKEMMEKYDTNKDGTLSDDEKKAMPPGMRWGMGGGRPGGQGGPGSSGGRRGGNRPGAPAAPAPAPPAAQ